MVKGEIFDIKHFAVHDGPGIRTTVFFKGCPMECWWCHNPEGISMDNEIFFYESKCIGCVKCTDVCPKSVIVRKDDIIQLNREGCTFCGRCSEICPTNALKIVGKEVTVDDVMEEILKSRIYYETSGGGITFSGGEPLMQPDFLKDLLTECKKEGIKCALDTSGFIPTDEMERLIDNIDLFLYDIKLLDDQKHKKYTGVSNRLVLDNLKTISEAGKEIIIRYPVIPGINDSEEDIDRLISLVSSLKNLKELDLLPYHNVCEKYKRLGKKYRLSEAEAPSNKKMKQIKKRLEVEGLKVKIGG
ncbi:MAG: glycyl-radical enzyme activating protein [Thermoplasmatota archaeon]